MLVVWSREEIAKINSEEIAVAIRTASKLGAVTGVCLSKDATAAFESAASASELLAWKTGELVVSDVKVKAGDIPIYFGVEVSAVKSHGKVTNPTVEMVRALAECDELTAWEEEFITSNMDRVEKYGASTRFSDKQQEIIEEMADKHDITV